MGAYQSGRSVEKRITSEVNFDHFQILRAIGKGSFGKVCIVQKKDTKKLYAMKYMNKRQCAERAALMNVLREVDILRSLEHPFLVNLWFSFQDEEDLFLVSDLLLGGDLRYHVARGAAFDPDCVLLYVCELAAALDFLQSRRILHRDIKPDNILLDEEGHVHLTDFNIAVVLEEGQLATSMSGTKPYMAPEIFDCAVDECSGYSYPVDWWSLGVCAYEMLQGTRPFDIHSATSISDVRALFFVGPKYSSNWSQGLKDLLSRLLSVQPGGRICSFDELKKIKCSSHLDLDTVLQKKIKPTFVPPKNHLNCDPTYELEEMIIEAKPLHKKKKRLAKQRSLREMQGSLSVELEMDFKNEAFLQQLPNFQVYNREVELENREREYKERRWEEELLQAMDASDPIAGHGIAHHRQRLIDNHNHCRSLGDTSFAEKLDKADIQNAKSRSLEITERTGDVCRVSQEKKPIGSDNHEDRSSLKLVRQSVLDRIVSSSHSPKSAPSIQGKTNAVSIETSDVISKRVGRENIPDAYSCQREKTISVAETSLKHSVEETAVQCEASSTLRISSAETTLVSTRISRE